MNTELIEFYKSKNLIFLRKYVYLDSFQKQYFKNNLEVDVSILKYWKNKKFKEIVNIENKYTELFMDSFLFEEKDDSLIFHVEFDRALFFYLINQNKEDIAHFFKIIDDNFKKYLQKSGTYHIPHNLYKKFYTSLDESSEIRKAIIILNQLGSYSIDRQGGDVLIRAEKIKGYLEELKNYKF